MTSDDLIKDICIKELQLGCYRHTINGISIYNYVQKFLRKQKCREYGFIAKYKPGHADKKTITVTIIRSTYQLLSLLLFKKNISNFIYSFPRVDNVNGFFLDKFTDPVIDNSIVKDQGYIIFEKGKNYTHSTPRYHSDKVIYCDAIDYYSDLIAKLSLRWFIKKYNYQFEGLWKSVDATFPNVKYNKKITAHTILSSYISTIIYKYIFKRLSIVNFFAPGRGAFSTLIPAAKLSGVKVFEMQHGITYGESVTYSGYRDPMFTPDYFLSFGENRPVDVYGIDPDKMVTIGYAFFDYLNNVSSVLKNIVFPNQDILVVSDPQITTSILSVVFQLAESNTSIVFHFRPHPEEYLTEEQKENISKIKNIVVDDNRQNIMVVLSKYLHIIGENSTVLYEALSMGKKVGKLCMGGLKPRYLNEEDVSYFYEIDSLESFIAFLKSPKDSKPQKQIYTRYRPEIFNNLLQ